MDTRSYNNCYIYKLISKDPNIKDIYVGHSVEYPTIRYSKHKYDSKTYPKRHIYSFINKNGGIDNFVLEKIEDYPCNSRREAENREEYYVKLLGAGLNKNKNIVLTAEKLREKLRKHYEIKKDKILARQKIYYNKNKISILEKMKEYRLNPIRKNKLLDTTWYERNKHITSECCCGMSVSKNYIKEHMKTKKHLEALLAI